MAACSSTGTPTVASTRHYTRYEIYFDGSVSGLSEGGQVRYLGVDIGRVARIRVDRAPPIACRCWWTSIPRRRSRHARWRELSLQGVTGLLYIDLQQQRAGLASAQLMDPVPRASNIP